ncbi:MAG: peptidylprolyl isomerase [Nanoarchaeota archaeon]|nr:peptidylprolyl isomerase [Nanoarchaeota archaeon]
MTLATGTKVKFHYTGKLQSGEVFDSSEGKEPLVFEVGKEMIIPGLEKEIVKLSVGDKKTIEVSPEEGYGHEVADLLQEIPKAKFPQSMGLEKDAVVYLKTPDGQTIPARVKDVKEHTIVLDFNHPLAGKDLYYHVKVVSVRPASVEELEYLRPCEHAEEDSAEAQGS